MIPVDTHTVFVSIVTSSALVTKTQPGVEANPGADPP
jgi:hypothetical protein